MPLSASDRNLSKIYTYFWSETDCFKVSMRLAILCEKNKLNREISRIFHSLHATKICPEFKHFYSKNPEKLPSFFIPKKPAYIQ